MGLRLLSLRKRCRCTLYFNNIWVFSAIYLVVTMNWNGIVGFCCEFLKVQVSVKWKASHDDKLPAYLSIRVMSSSCIDLI